MTLYRIDASGYWEGKPLRDLIARMIEAAVLVPVDEPLYRKATTEEEIHYRHCTNPECPQQFKRMELMVLEIGDTDEV